MSTEKFSYSSESDDDAPGEISSSVAKNTKLSEVRSNRQRDKEAKEREREKRRTRNEMFNAQKKQKLESFGDRALPADILEAVAGNNDKLDEELEQVFGDVNDDDDSGGDSEGGSGSDSDDDFSDDDDFIALDSNSKRNSLNVVTVQDPKKNVSSLERALAFRNTKLFSGPNAPNRCSAEKRRRLAQKRKMMQMK